MVLKGTGEFSLIWHWDSQRYPTRRWRCSNFKIFRESILGDTVKSHCKIRDFLCPFRTSFYPPDLFYFQSCLQPRLLWPLLLSSTAAYVPYWFHTHSKINPPLCCYAMHIFKSNQFFHQLKRFCFSPRMTTNDWPVHLVVLLSCSSKSKAFKFFCFSSWVD